MRTVKEFVEWGDQKKPLHDTTATITRISSSSCYAMLCPRCGTNNLHHGRVTVYDRAEDKVATTVVTVDGCELSRSERPSNRCGNPSSRRHGLAVLFTCEGCATWSELTVEQHKGETYLHWRDPVMS